MTFDELKSNLRTVVVSIVVAAVGVGLLYLSSLDDFWEHYKTWQSVLRTVASLLFVSVTINLLWQLFGKRVFLDEILSKAQVSKEITFSGITKITDSFHRDIEWARYFSTVSKLDIFFAYGRTWRNSHVEELQELAKREGARIRVVLPDPDDEKTLIELSKRFRYTSEQTANHINEAKEFFIKLPPKSGTHAEVSIWLIPAAPLFSFYRFDRIGILALYAHRSDRVPIPTFVCESGGTLYDFLRKEFDAMIADGGLAKLVYPTPIK